MTQHVVASIPVSHRGESACSPGTHHFHAVEQPTPVQRLKDFIPPAPPCPGEVAHELSRCSTGERESQSANKAANPARAAAQPFLSSSVRGGDSGTNSGDEPLLSQTDKTTFEQRVAANPCEARASNTARDRARPKVAEQLQVWQQRKGSTKKKMCRAVRSMLRNAD